MRKFPLNVPCKLIAVFLINPRSWRHSETHESSGQVPGNGNGSHGRQDLGSGSQRSRYGHKHVHLPRPPDRTYGTVWEERGRLRTHAVDGRVTPGMQHGLRPLHLSYSGIISVLDKDLLTGQLMEAATFCPSPEHMAPGKVPMEAEIIPALCLGHVALIH